MATAYRRMRQHGVLDAVERWTGLTGLGLLLLLGGALAIWAGRRLGSAGLSILGYVLVLVLVLVWLLARRRVTVTAQRGSLPRRVPVGRKIVTDITLTAGHRQTSVVAEEALPHNLGDRVRIAIPVLPAGRPSTHPYEFRAERRGSYQVGPLTLERVDPFGLVRSWQEIAPATTFIVHPRTEPVVDRILSREFEDPILRPPHSQPWPTGAEFYGMRPYQRGDDPRRIVWRAVARRGEIVVRESERGITDTVCVLLDTCQTSYRGRDLSPAFERAVSVVASVGCHHLASGFSVSVESNAGPLIERLRGKQDRIELLDALAACDREREALPDAVHRLLLRRGADGHHVVVTAQLTAQSTAALRLFIDRGRSVVVVLVLDEHTEPTTMTHAMSLRCPVVDIAESEAMLRPFRHALSLRPR